MADELRKRVEELERKMDLIAKWVDPSRSGYASPQLHRDLTTPPPKPRPVIEVVAGAYGWHVKCGDHYWLSAVEKWNPRDSGGALTKFTADALRAALTAAGNYPAEYQETSR